MDVKLVEVSGRRQFVERDSRLREYVAKESTCGWDGREWGEKQGRGRRKGKKGTRRKESKRTSP